MQALAAGCLTLLFALCLGGLTILKETPHFWTNAGGYPIGLRHFVLHGYYPVLFAYLLILVALTMRGIYLFFKQESASGLVFLIALAPAWICTGLVIGLLIANNVINLIEGKPFHSH